MAALLSVSDSGLQEELFAAARTLKRTVYGNRIVLFAPLYIGNKCTNSCRYCGFRAENEQVVRRTLTTSELRAEVLALIAKGHKRLVIDYGEHPDYSAEVIAHAVESSTPPRPATARSAASTSTARPSTWRATA